MTGLVRPRTFFVPFVFALFGFLCLIVGVAHAATGADPGLGDVDDVFAAGRRAGFLWIAVGLGIAMAMRAIGTRLKPRDDAEPAAGSWRAKLSIVLGGGFAVTAAVVDMYASSRGFAPVTTAAFGAIALYFGAKDDPARGSKRAPDEAPREDVPVPPPPPGTEAADQIERMRRALPPEPEPDCRRCADGLPFTLSRMFLCPTCGNKRCPKASDHDNACSGSNAPGQPGSVYP